MEEWKKMNETQQFKQKIGSMKIGKYDEKL
jgi:hypothetical protein